MKYLIAALIILFIYQKSTLVWAQEKQKNKGIFVESKNAFFEGVEASLDSFYTEPSETVMTFQMDFEGYDIPNSKSDFTEYWHNDPVSQANTSTCWSFSTTSFYESEIYRLFNKKVKLSEMWTAYWEFVEKARGFVQSRGKWRFTAGSESNAVKRIWEKYGVVPSEVYTGLLPDQKYLNTSDMFREMTDYLNYVKSNKLWNEDVVIGTIKSIMDHWIGNPPKNFEFEGKIITPQEYLSRYLKLNLDDYVDVLSLMQEPYFEFVEYKVPDNWWHNKDYFNIPLNDFMK
ncbi:MAG: C1 family peptidase, partial [Melioribacteraceae bacterium]|nr:C1 family peptidase [Melioribacteraceae bacterium]